MTLSAKETTPRKVAEVTCLFVDIGEVLLTNGWDRVRLASFGLELDREARRA